MADYIFIDERGHELATETIHGNAAHVAAHALWLSYQHKIKVTAARVIVTGLAAGKCKACGEWLNPAIIIKCCPGCDQLI